MSMNKRLLNRLSHLITKAKAKNLAAAMAIVLLSGCAALIGAAAVTSIDVMHDRRTAGNYLDDNALEVKLRTTVFRDPLLKGNTNISITSMNGIVLLTGETPTTALKKRVQSYAEQMPEVRQIINEIGISGKTSLGSRSNDAWITSKVKTLLYSETGLNASRVKVVTERGGVYLLGIVSRAEARRAVRIVASVKGVTKVIKVFEYT